MYTATNLPAIGQTVRVITGALTGTIGRVVAAVRVSPEIALISIDTDSATYGFTPDELTAA